MGALLSAIVSTECSSLFTCAGGQYIKLLKHGWTLESIEQGLALLHAHASVAGIKLSLYSRTCHNNLLSTEITKLL